jgi:hypothetical protein
MWRRALEKRQKDAKTRSGTSTFSFGCNGSSGMSAGNAM